MGWSKKTRGILAGQARAGRLFILPSMLVLTVFTFIPLVAACVFSFLNFNMMMSDAHFIALHNYARLLSASRFWNALFNTFKYTIGTVPIEILLALMAAVAICKQTKLNNFFKSVFFLPAISSMTIISIIWSFLLNKDIGIYAYYLHFLGLQLPELLKDPVLAMPTIVAVSIWKNFGFNMVILISGLLAIPSSYYEAADIDGASASAKLFRITIPLLKPTLTFVVINCIISSFQVFDQVYVMTHGGPLFKTETMVQYIYNSAFQDYDMGYACAAAVILLAVTLLASIPMYRSMQRGEENLN